MAVDTKKLMAFLKSGMSPFPPPMAVPYEPPLPQGLDEGDVDEIREEIDDDASETSQMMRKLSPEVAYMEISEPAGGFSCGSCKYATPEGVCLHAAVRAPVSAENGCCNKFWPSAAQVTFPPQDKPSIFKDEDEDEGEAETESAEEAPEEEG